VRSAAAVRVRAAQLAVSSAPVGSSASSSAGRFTRARAVAGLPGRHAGQLGGQQHVVHHGHVVEQGSHEDLLARHGFYHDLYNSQFASTSAGGEPSRLAAG
jgi:hypothetical protein